MVLDGRHLTYLLTALGEAGYGVHGVGSPFVFRELVCLRKSVAIPFVIGGKKRECGISISDKSGFNHREHRAHGGGKRFILNYDYFSGLTTTTTGCTDGHADVAGPCLGKPSGAAFSNLFPSELARYSENTSLTRSTSVPAIPLRADDWGNGKR